MASHAKTPKRRRHRGVILTREGIARLLAAKADDEYTHNQGHRYTLEVLSERTGVGMDTLTKVFACEVRVDKQTLKCCFSSFNLDLTTADYYSPYTTNPTSARPTQTIASQPATVTSAPPGGQLSITSPVYISRLTAERNSYQAIDQPGALIRIQGSRQMGKTSLMTRLSQQAQQRQYQTVYISFQMAETTVLQDLDKLLQWFCASISLGLSRQPDLDTYWDSLFGSKMSCKFYLEQYLLPAVRSPVVLLLDDVERLFNYPQVADEFFGLLRTCYEEAKSSPIWQRLRVVLAQASEVYIPLNINKSPFNVGMAIPLLPFTPEQTQQLAAAYSLSWSTSEATALCQLINGQPYLTHLAAYHTWQSDTTPNKIIEQGAHSPVFLPYLQQQERKLRQHSTLAQVLSQLISEQSYAPNALPDIYRLQSLGLVTLGENGPQLASKLLTDYFSVPARLEHISLKNNE